LRRARNPIRWSDYMANESARARYWARSMIGWPRMTSARPNPAHRALASLEHAGIVRGLITQNVDRLHHAAGSRRVIELHGALADVVCLECGAIEGRGEVQERLLTLNAHWKFADAEMAPDGDAEIALTADGSFRVPSCLLCEGTLKPDVVFFGENVPRAKVDIAFGMVDDADALLVVGSSLAVYSGFRFVRRASERGAFVAIVNRGPTRGDPLATTCIDGAAGELIPALAQALTE
jgi:NAD-dependent deacetylase sirtuin 4